MTNLKLKNWFVHTTLALHIFDIIIKILQKVESQWHTIIAIKDRSTSKIVFEMCKIMKMTCIF
jgi:hypothetical protein